MQPHATPSSLASCCGCLLFLRCCFCCAGAVACRPAAALALCRCLRPPAAAALNACQPPHMLHTALLPATHLTADLHSKLKLLHARARRPAGLMPPPAAPAAAAAMSAGGMFAAVMAPSGPACLEGLGLQQFVSEVVVPLLPALQQHLVMACNVIKQPPQNGLDSLFEGMLAAAFAWCCCSCSAGLA